MSFKSLSIVLHWPHQNPDSAVKWVEWVLVSLEERLAAVNRHRMKTRPGEGDGNKSIVNERGTTEGNRSLKMEEKNSFSGEKGELDSKVDDLIKKMKNGLDLSALPASGIMDVYEHKLASLQLSVKWISFLHLFSSPRYPFDYQHLQLSHIFLRLKETEGNLNSATQELTSKQEICVMLKRHLETLKSQYEEATTNFEEQIRRKEKKANEQDLELQAAVEEDKQLAKDKDGLERINEKLEKKQEKSQENIEDLKQQGIILSPSTPPSTS
ncbi:hypothetical protein BSL78_29510 [Apostichopus japonicus]|uniref:Uncharacterized protein n=1 Tax=Stichopus japonicus TaxID=307972 RepID=A0A2G8JD55_STIJA|nr:hypothetical protein BSL78_29510 [Apostichopus japonicus]